MTDRTALPPGQYLRWAADQLAAHADFRDEALPQALKECAQAYDRLVAHIAELRQERQVWEDRAVRSGTYLHEQMAENEVLQASVHSLREALHRIANDDAAGVAAVRQAQVALAREPSGCLNEVRQEAVMSAVGGVRVALAEAGTVPHEAEQVLKQVLAQARIQLA